MKKYKPYLTRVDLVKNQVEREKLAEQEAKASRKKRAQQQNRERWLRYQEQLRSELAARYFHGVVSAGGESFSNTYSVAFDGTDDHIDCGTTLGDHLGGNYTGDQTVSLWYKRTSSRIEGPFILGNQNFAYGRGLGLLFVNNDLRISIMDNWRAAYTTTFDTNWHHVLYSAKNNGDNTFDLKLYLDGTPVINTTVDIGRNTLALSPNVITWIGRASSYEFQGNIDEVAFWDSDQSGNIDSIYSADGPQDLDSLNPLTWWRFEEGSGTTATDSGTLDNDGTLTSDPTYSTDVPTN